MRRKLLLSPAFKRAARQMIKKYPAVKPSIASALSALEDDISHPSLKTHKLKGRLKDRFACSGGYDLRIIFKLIKHEGQEAILLLTVGKHDDVY
ncbi:MAG: hypothetical protein O2955_13275 [Planctomycetota bacterium]|nr:hypothetical protein [Planctomycetota bacterium]MDA1213482.1 hypothetical protein [Planctomycetota bacterium]